MKPPAGLSIGALARRTGLAVSAIRYYEAQGLLAPWRNAGGQRRFARADIRRLSFVRIAQQFGFTLPESAPCSTTCPAGAPRRRRTGRGSPNGSAPGSTSESKPCRPCATTWTAASAAAASRCPKCALYNPGDRAGEKGSGPRYLMGGQTGNLSVS